MFVYANMTEEQLRMLKATEERIGVNLVALTDVPLPMAFIDAEALMEIQELEQNLGACVVAVQRPE